MFVTENAVEHPASAGMTSTNIVESVGPQFEPPLHQERPSAIALRAKRVGDLIMSSVLIIGLLPLLAVVCLAIRLGSPGPVLFHQARLGLDGEPFTIFKFRTMFDGADRLERLDDEGATIQAPDDPRVTFVGRRLRASSIDELPQLWNVLKGDMSIVGPRPDLAESISLYNDSMMRKLKMRPGITGLAMIRGRNSIPWSSRVAWDVRYVDTWSLALDLRVLVETIGVVLTRRGVFSARSDA
jgi:lipopolysaccharide/colanic/teichoic acid biosynthesis glycosyltransferase